MLNEVKFVKKHFKAANNAETPPKSAFQRSNILHKSLVCTPFNYIYEPLKMKFQIPTNCKWTPQNCILLLFAKREVTIPSKLQVYPYKLHIFINVNNNGSTCNFEGSTCNL